MENQMEKNVAYEIIGYLNRVLGIPTVIEGYIALRV